MSRCLSILIVAIACLIRPVIAFAWGTDGHRIVCAIAWDEMTPRAKNGAERILDVHTREAFADTCNWADEYRGHGHQETAPWHYVDVPVGATKVDMARDCPAPKSCAVERIVEDARALRRMDRGVNRAMALKFLAHFVGDIHQPLHVSHAIDEGGIKIKGTFKGRTTNLHSVWDFGIIRNAGLPWTEIADYLEHHITPAERKAWAASRPLDWANESLTIANSPNTQYVDQQFNLDGAYEARELPVAYERLSQAGVRLANLLNQDLR